MLLVSNEQFNSVFVCVCVWVMCVHLTTPHAATIWWIISLSDGWRHICGLSRVRQWIAQNSVNGVLWPPTQDGSGRPPHTLLRTHYTARILSHSCKHTSTTSRDSIRAQMCAPLCMQLHTAFYCAVCSCLGVCECVMCICVIFLHNDVIRVVWLYTIDAMITLDVHRQVPKYIIRTERVMGTNWTVAARACFVAIRPDHTLRRRAPAGTLCYIESSRASRFGPVLGGGYPWKREWTVARCCCDITTNAKRRKYSRHRETQLCRILGNTLRKLLHTNNQV